MNRLVPVLIAYLLISFNLFGIERQESESRDSININDGPYIFLVNDTLKTIRIENGQLNKSFFVSGNRSPIQLTQGLTSNYKVLTRVFKRKPDYRQSYKRVDSIAVISDVHGHYDTFLRQLISNDIIDENLNWKFGKGHLVFLGDAFDRGEEVTELLWSLFILQQRAARAGGKVHVLLGNHEEMVLNNYLSYINEKYIKVEAICHTTYTDLFSPNSVLGRWIRSLPVIITINDIIFVHAGISPEFVSRELKISQVNKQFSEQIIGKDISSIPEENELTFLGGNDGPLWYRGYFSDTTFTENKLDSILDFYSKKHIIVGHTTHKEMKLLFNNKIFGIDAGIAYEQPGKMLIYKNGIFYEASIDGKRVQL
jgi:hypothetical protein